MAERSNPFIKETMGKGDKGSRAKSEKAAERANDDIRKADSDQSSWPLGSKGTPMIKAEMAASELIPTGQYANVTVGPCRIHFLIDPDQDLDGEGYFSHAQRDAIAKALNEAAEIVEADVIAVQRNLVLESLQQQGESK